MKIRETDIALGDILFLAGVAAFLALAAIGLVDVAKWLWRHC